MRHLSTLIAAVFIAPFSWLLLAFGQDRSVQAFANAKDAGAFNTGDFVRPMMCLAGAGLLLGLLATLRFSPLGVVLTGAGYATSYLALLFDPDGVLDLFPQHLSVAGRSVDATTPIRTGTTLLLGALMVVAAASVSRWRRRPFTGEPERQESERQPAAEPAQDWPADVRTPIAERELVTRYADAPRSGNRGPNSYGWVDNSTDRWEANRQSILPYAQRAQTWAQDRRLEN